MKKLIKYRVPMLFSGALVLFVCGLLLMENMITQLNQKTDEPVSTTEVPKDVTPSEPTGAEAVEEETLIAPVKDGISIVRHFYVSNDDSERQKVSMDYFEGVYRPSLGVDYAGTDGAFEVLSSLSGTVEEVKTDPLFGQCVTISCADDWMLIYQSLGEVSVKEGDTIKQGSVLGKSGENVYEADLGNHVHFVLEKDGKQYDPESNFGKKLTQIA